MLELGTMASLDFHLLWGGPWTVRNLGSQHSLGRIYPRLTSTSYTSGLDIPLSPGLASLGHSLESLYVRVRHEDILVYQEGLCN